MNVRSSLVLLVLAFNVSCSGDVRIIGDVNSGGATNSAGTKAQGGSSVASNSNLGGTTDLVGGARGTGGSSSSPTTASTVGGMPSFGGTGALGGRASLGGSAAFGGNAAFGGTTAAGGSAALGGSAVAGGRAALGGSAALGGATSVPVCASSVGPGINGQSCTQEGYACQFAGSPCGGFMRCEGGAWKQETVCPSGTGGTSSGGRSSLGGSSSVAGTAGTGGVNCACLRGAYAPVCGSDGVTYDASCGESCVPVAIVCYHTCPCPSGAGGAANGGASGSAITGGTSATGTSTSTSYGGLCNSGCSLAQVTTPSICQSNQELVACTSPNPDLSTIMSANGCTDSGLDMIAFCCPTQIENQCS